METYIEAFVNIAGPMLGTSVSLTSLLSGEMKDTAQLGAFEPYLMGETFGAYRRAQLFRWWVLLQGAGRVRVRNGSMVRVW